MNYVSAHRPRHRWFHLVMATLLLLGGLFMVAPAPVAAATCVVTNTNGQGAGSLKACVIAAAAGDTITFSLPNPSTIVLNFGGMTINKSLTITGPGASQLAISGNDASTIFQITSGTVQISGLTLTNGRGYLGGALQQTGGTLTLSNVVVQNSQVTTAGGASPKGGGIAILGGTATLNATTVRANTGSNGGGLYIGNDFAAANVTLQGGTAITGNTGGGIAVINFGSANTPLLTMTDSVVSGNSSVGIAISHGESWPGAVVALTNTTVSGNASGIFSLDGAVTLTNSAIDANLGGGSGISAQGGTLTVTGGTINRNAFTGIFCNFGTALTVTNATISNNANAGISCSGSLTLLGSTISGNGGDGVAFNNSSSAVITASVTNSTISGNSGRGLNFSVGNDANQSYSTLAVTGSTISGNASAGVSTSIYSTTTIDGSTISGNAGGGSYNNGTLTITGTTISGNTNAGDGGGISNNGTLTVTGSAISGNTALITSGDYGNGGGIYNNGALTLTNSTISGNSAADAGGGLFSTGQYSGGSVTTQASLSFVTITGNTAVNYGGGIVATTATIAAAPTANIAATTTIGRSVIVGNRRGTVPDDCATGSVALAPLTSQGYNVVGNAARCPANGPGDLAIEDAATVLNPTLAANGGATKTHALVAGSPALNRVPANACQGANPSITTDQRGGARPQGAGCDSGAVETTGTPNATVTAPPACTVVTSAADRGAGTLRQCVASAAPGATITFNLALPATITLTTGAIVIDKSLTIQGPGAGSLTVDGGAWDRVITITTGTVAISGLTVRNGLAASILAVGGAGIAVEPAAGVGPTVALTNLVVRDNIVGSGGPSDGSRGFCGNLGGGIYARNTALTVTNSTISGNTTRRHCGYVRNRISGAGLAIVADGTGSASATIVGSTIADNQARTRAETLTDPYTNTTAVYMGLAEGGGVYALNSALSITGSTISGNTFARIDGNTNLDGSSINRDGIFGQGGGIFASGGTLAVTNSTVSGNLGSTGGGIFNAATSATLSFVTVTGNTATKTTGGGGLAGAAFNVAGSIVVGNRRGTASPVASDCVVTTSTSGGYNVVGGGTGCPSAGTGDATAGDPATVLDPALAANGGPTKTHALVAGSPALDRVPTANCAAAAGVDQRGGARPQGAACDSGAFEGVGATAGGLALTLTVVSGGQVQLAPPGTVSGGGTFPYTQGTVVTLTPQPGAGQTFTGWLFDGAYRGWAAPLTLTMDASHSVQATFAPTKTFPDVPGNRADFVAITELASRTTIRGYANGNYGPDDGVQRAQMAALIARATSAGPGTPTGGTLTPPACLAAGTWDCEDWGNGFSDRNGLDANLWRNVGALQHYQVAFGYDGAACAARGVAPPCYAPTAPVSYVETIVFITRAMVAKGYWVMQPNTPQPYTGVPAVFGPTVATYQFYTAGAGGVQAAPGDWNAGSTRGWFARALWQALNTYWATDGQLPDGRNAGGFVP